MLKVTATPYSLPLKHPFTISRYTVTNQQTVIVSISDGNFVGYGEATANPYYNSTSDKILKSVASIQKKVEQHQNSTPEELWKYLEPFLKDDYFALCAIDCAFWDFYAKKNERTLRSFWTMSEQSPLSNFTIGIDSIPNMIHKIKETPWPTYKIKLGISEDLNIMNAIRKSTDAILRVDANASWSANETIKKSHSLKELNVEFIEQPLNADDWKGMRTIKNVCTLPLIADESCKRLEDIIKCTEAFHGINIKLMKCGGITPALKMIKEARNQNLTVMAGCMTESSIGISNLTQLAPLLDAIDADGALLLAKDLATGTIIKDGEIHFSKQNGNGILNLFE